MRKAQEGFTLIELVVTLALCSVLLLAVTDSFTDWLKQKEQVLAESELAENLNYAMGELAYDLRQAVWVIPQPDSAELVLVNEAGDTIRYQLSSDTMSEEHPYLLSGQVLYRLENGGRKQPVANFVAQLSVGYTYEAEAADGSVTAVQIRLSGQAQEKTLTLERTLPVGGYWWRKAGMEVSR